MTDTSVQTPTPKHVEAQHKIWTLQLALTLTRRLTVRHVITFAGMKCFSRTLWETARLCESNLLLAQKKAD